MLYIQTSQFDSIKASDKTKLPSIECLGCIPSHANTIHQSSRNNPRVFAKARPRAQESFNQALLTETWSLAGVGVAVASVLALVSALLDNPDLAVGASKAGEQSVISGHARECALGICNRIPDLGVVVALISI